MSHPPESFSWVIPGLLAASACPRNTRNTFEFFKDEGIDVVVSLTESPLNAAIVSEFGFTYHHIPIDDFTAPDARQIDRFVSIVREAVEAKHKVLVHCLGGRGRTGTMLACYLVSQGKSAEDALAEIRALRPGSVETPRQRESVILYERRLQRKKAH